MTGGPRWVPRPLVRAVLDVPARVATIGAAVWLYVYLLAEAGHRGRLCRQVDHIAADLGVPEMDIASWVSTLTATKLVTVLNPSPYLVIKLALWSGSGDEREAISTETASDSQSSKAIAIAISNQGEDGAQGEGEELLREVLETLGESDPGPFQKVLGRYDAAVVRRALARVRAADPGRIRKSKTALFRYLLTRLA